MLDRKDKDNIVRLYKLNVPIATISSNYNINRRTIYDVIKTEGVKARTVQLSIQEKCEIVKDFLSGERATIVAEKYKISVKTVYNILKTNNISYRHGTRKHFFNENYFSKPCSNNCYWAGFIAADGGIFKNTLHIGLNKRDVKHLETFVNNIEGDHKIQECKKKIVRISVCSKKMITDLREIFNIYANKTKTVIMPFLCEDLSKNYIRGYFDGDGSIYMNPKKMLICFSITSGSYSMVNKIRDSIELFTNQKCGLYRYKNKFSIAISGSKAIKVMDWLYLDSNVYLDRKFKKYKEFIKMRECYDEFLHNNIRGIAAKIGTLRKCGYNNKYIEESI